MSGAITSNSLRRCACCGEPSATRSIPACWDHWIVLPEDLRSTIVISAARGQLNLYGNSLTEAVRIWRQLGVWRSRYRPALASVAKQAAIASEGAAAKPKIISLLERRSKAAAALRPLAAPPAPANIRRLSPGRG